MSNEGIYEIVPEKKISSLGIPKLVRLISIWKLPSKPVLANVSCLQDPEMSPESPRISGNFGKIFLLPELWKMYRRSLGFWQVISIYKTQEFPGGLQVVLKDRALAKSS